MLAVFLGAGLSRVGGVPLARSCEWTEELIEGLRLPKSLRASLCAESLNCGPRALRQPSPIYTRCRASGELEGP